MQNEFTENVCCVCEFDGIGLVGLLPFADGADICPFCAMAFLAESAVAVPAGFDFKNPHELLGALALFFDGLDNWHTNIEPRLRRLRFASKLAAPAALREWALGVETYDENEVANLVDDLLPALAFERIFEKLEAPLALMEDLQTVTVPSKASHFLEVPGVRSAFHFWLSANHTARDEFFDAGRQHEQFASL